MGVLRSLFNKYNFESHRTLSCFPPLLYVVGLRRYLQSFYQVITLIETIQITCTLACTHFSCLYICIIIFIPTLAIAIFMFALHYNVIADVNRIYERRSEVSHTVTMTSVLVFNSAGFASLRHDMF